MKWLKVLFSYRSKKMELMYYNGKLLRDLWLLENFKITYFIQCG